ncbi:MAG: hypothetical protein RMK80_00480 [Pseudobdellovibrionaceae bacterium]|nr:hypothetical protein [Pseudobdellovibrionaceae bacterium]
MAIALVISIVAFWYSFNLINQSQNLEQLEHLKVSVEILKSSLKNMIENNEIYNFNFQKVITPIQYPSLAQCVLKNEVRDGCEAPFHLALKFSESEAPFVGSIHEPAKYSFTGLACGVGSVDAQCPIGFYNECVMRCPGKGISDTSGACPQRKKIYCNFKVVLPNFQYLANPELLNKDFETQVFSLVINSTGSSWVFVKE